MTQEFEVRWVQVKKFKRISEAQADLGGLNVLVGGNNSGKSSFLQAIHFGVIAAVAARKVGRETFTQDALLYCPSKDFTQLRHGEPYLNQSNFGYLDLKATESATGDDAEYKIIVYRGRNEGNVGVTRSGDRKLGQAITDDARPFSIYAPGLAGVPRSEEFRSESVILRGVAGGDANLYLRNVLLLIKRKDLINDLVQRMRRVFPDFWIDVQFDPRSEVHISVVVSTTGRVRTCPLELTGTGVLQALQIFSYITLFSPTLLLLDEPDAHLHPNNQALLARALISASEHSETQVICSTHSRHLVDALHDDAQLIWLQAGGVKEQGRRLPKVPVLMDLGAIDALDRLQGGNIDHFVLTEDSDDSYLRTMLSSAGFDLTRAEIRHYGSSSRLEAALELARYVREVAPATNVIVHRDRDFMTDEEVQWTREKILRAGAKAFITEGSDIEAAFVTPVHVAEVYEVDVAEAEEWLNELAARNHVALQHAFTRKRDDVKSMLYRSRVDAPPDTLNLMGNDVPLPAGCRRGKDMLRLCNGDAHARFGRFRNVNVAGNGLGVATLVALR